MLWNTEIGKLWLKARRIRQEMTLRYLILTKDAPVCWCQNQQFQWCWQIFGIETGIAIMFYFLTVFRLLILEAININRPKPYRYLIQSHFKILTRKRNNIIFESYLLYVLESILIYFEVHNFFTFEFDKNVVVFFGFGIQLKRDQNLTMIHFGLPYNRIC